MENEISFRFQVGRLFKVNAFVFPCVFAFLICVFASSRLSAQVKDTVYGEAIAVIDYWLDSQKDFEKLPGISVAIVKDQQMVWSKGYGYADMQKKVPMDAGTLCSI